MHGVLYKLRGDMHDATPARWFLYFLRAHLALYKYFCTYTRTASFSSRITAWGWRLRVPGGGSQVLLLVSLYVNILGGHFRPATSERDVFIGCLFSGKFREWILIQLEVLFQDCQIFIWFRLRNIDLSSFDTSIINSK